MISMLPAESSSCINLRGHFVTGKRGKGRKRETEGMGEKHPPKYTVPQTKVHLFIF